ncbi:MAG: NAD(P)/FAD-dependent oxidoreductase [Actinobacteria bacterium]|nr:NAD(P)/FAD-dependent oxidoreductase [Actinomycetota bacterium]
MTQRYDVVVVGARCAGATLAHDLARAGLSVALVDRAGFPSDTLSTHYFESPGIATLGRLGVLDEMRAAGAPFIDFIDYRIADVSGVDPLYRDPGAPGGAMCVRRTVLDAALVRVAGEAGADVLTNTRVTGLLTSDGRVTGVAHSDDAGRDGQLDATVVVGADGTGSTVARLAGARRYHTMPNQRFCYWGYFEGATESGPPAALYHRFDDDLSIGFACDSGLYVAITLPPLEALPSFGNDLEGNFSTTMSRCEPLAGILSSARRVGPLRGMANYPPFFRESAGPGWALVGDAGHFKDPSVAQGISDAFRQAERLAEHIVAGLGGVTPVDDALAAWWAWRDADAIDMHWLSADMGAAGPVPAVLVELLRDLQATPARLWDFWALFNHRGSPADVFAPERFAAVAERLAGTPSGPQIMAELGAMEELAEQRARLVASPSFVDDSSPPRPRPEALSNSGVRAT